MLIGVCETQLFRTTYALHQSVSLVLATMMMFCQLSGPKSHFPPFCNWSMRNALLYGVSGFGAGYVLTESAKQKIHKQNLRLVRGVTVAEPTKESGPSRIPDSTIQESMTRFLGTLSVNTEVAACNGEINNGGLMRSLQYLNGHILVEQTSK